MLFCIHIHTAKLLSALLKGTSAHLFHFPCPDLGCQSQDQTADLPAINLRKLYEATHVYNRARNKSLCRQIKFIWASACNEPYSTAALANR